MPINRWEDKVGVVYIHNGILLSHLKEWNIIVCNNMGGPGGNYAKWNKSERGRQTLKFHLYVEPKKTKQMNKQCKTETESWIQRTNTMDTPWGGRGRGWGGDKYVSEIGRHRLPVAKQMRPRDGMHSMGNRPATTQYLCVATYHVIILKCIEI